jgi:hypothetical protein
MAGFLLGCRRARAYDAAAMKKARGDQPGLLAQF